MLVFILDINEITSDQSQPEVLFDFNKFMRQDLEFIGGFIGPSIRISDFDLENDLMFFAGGLGGIIINHKFVIGGGGYGLIEPIRISSDSLLDVGYGGVFLQYIVKPEQVLHYAFSGMLGAGAVNFLQADGETEIGDPETFFVMEPAANLELNIAKFVRVEFGISYRLVFGIDLFEYSNTDFSTKNYYFVLKLGSF